MQTAKELVYEEKVHVIETEEIIVADVEIEVPVEEKIVIKSDGKTTHFDSFNSF